MSSYFEDYLPGEYNRYSYGTTTPDLASKLQSYRNQLHKFIPQSREMSLDPSQRFKDFLQIQSNPESLAMSRMKLPKTPFGSFDEFVNLSSSM